MQELWKLVSSPRHLMVFEAAARHQSFTSAAEELNTQQPAISTAIKQLEQALGVLLFTLQHKKRGVNGGWGASSFCGSCCTSSGLDIGDL